MAIRLLSNALMKSDDCKFLKLHWARAPVIRNVNMTEAVALILQLLRRHIHDNTRRDKDVIGRAAGITNKVKNGVATDDCFFVSMTAIPLKERLVSLYCFWTVHGMCECD